MARYTTTVRSSLPSDEVFAFMADLRNFERWDPGVLGVSQIDGDGGGPGATFDVRVKAIGGGTTLRYRTTVHDAPHHLQVEAHSRLLTSIDRIDIEPAGDGCVVTYDAELRLNGPLQVFDVALRPVFRRIGDRAAAGLALALTGERAGR